MKSPSTHNLDALPSINELKKISQSIATLDAIICPDWESRYFSFDCKWSAQEEVASMRNGSGDAYYILFNHKGALIYGFAHESTMSQWSRQAVKSASLKERIKAWFTFEKKIALNRQLWPGIVESVPEEFSDFIHVEPVRSSGATFCIWRKYTEDKWNIGTIAFPNDAYRDGSEDLLFILDGRASTYRKWAVEYYEEQFEHQIQKLPLALVEYVYQHKPITNDFVQQLNPHVEDWDQLANELEEIGYVHQIKN